MQIELLAPAGNLENFQAALDGGADAVYVGAPGFNARNPAKEPQLEDICIMLEECRKLGKKLYIAANSLLLQRELKDVLHSLAVLEQLQPDALIVQDYGLINLVRNYFPSLPLHGSTLMTVHNPEGVRFLGEQGFERVVLARELTLKEIAAVAAKCEGVELEIFIHGAMCFSFSGLCLFSSYLGGKSGLRGKCVQPCRRAYTTSGRGQGGAGRYLFSMNDLVGLEVVPDLVRQGIASLKIEGRLRSAHYVNSVVQAYRLVLDALDDKGNKKPHYEKALEEAKELEKMAMSRKTTSGYFASPQPADAVSASQSGNMGIHLGRFSAVKKGGNKNICRLQLQGELQRGDRLRLHFEPSGERVAFRLKRLFVAGNPCETAHKGERATLELPDNFAAPLKGHIEVFKVDNAPVEYATDALLSFAQAQETITAIRRQRRSFLMAVERELFPASLACNKQEEASSVAPAERGGKKAGKEVGNRGGKKGRKLRRKMEIEWWLKTDSLYALDYRFPLPPERYLLAFEKPLLRQAGQIKRHLGKRFRSIIWALPPVFLGNDLAQLRKQIAVLLRSGYRSFQLAHPSQLQFFAGEKVLLYGDYSLNIMNSQAAQLYANLGFSAAQLSVELDREKLAAVVAGMKNSFCRLQPGLYVYGAPALYTARLHNLPLEKELLSPRKEPYIVQKKEGFTQTKPTRPFSLLPYMDEIKDMGVKYLVVDCCGFSRKKELEELSERLVGSGRYGKLSTFNYLGELQ